MPDFLPVILYPLLALIGLVFLAVAVGHLVATTGGWRDLVRAYPSPTTVPGRVIAYQGAQFKGANYAGVLQLTANPLGLRFELMRPFHFGSPPFFVPWAEVTGIVEKNIWGRLVVLNFARVPSVPVVIREKLAKRLCSESKGNWKFDGSYHMG